MHKIMIHRIRPIARGIWLMAALAGLGFVDIAQACSVCQGDPNSKLVQGAQAGVLLMAITTYVLLLGMAALVASWFIRQNRALRRLQTDGVADGVIPTDNADSDSA